MDSNDKTYHGMLGLVFLTLKIKIVLQSKDGTIEGSARDQHIEFAPAFLCALEGRFVHH